MRKLPRFAGVVDDPSRKPGVRLFNDVGVPVASGERRLPTTKARLSEPAPGTHLRTTARSATSNVGWRRVFATWERACAMQRTVRPEPRPHVPARSARWHGVVTR